MHAIHHRALLVVDVQAGFINDSTRHVPARIQKLCRRYPLVIATRFKNASDSAFRRLMGWHRFETGSEEIDLAFEPPAGSIIIDKTRYTCVDGPFLELLASRGINEVHLCGIDTDICVTKSAVDLFESGIRPVVLADYCASHAGRRFHNMALEILPRYVGAKQILHGDPPCA